MIGTIKRLTTCRRGATAIEYGLILALICVAVMAIVSTVASKTLRMWTNISSNMAVVG